MTGRMQVRERATLIVHQTFLFRAGQLPGPGISACSFLEGAAHPRNVTLDTAASGAPNYNKKIKTIGDDGGATPITAVNIGVLERPEDPNEGTLSDLPSTYCNVRPSRMSHT